MLTLVTVLTLLSLTPSQQMQAQARLKEGQELLERERPAEAAAAFRDAIRLDRLLVMAHYGLGQASMAQKDWPEAVRAFGAARSSFDELVASDVTARLQRDQQRDDRVRELQDRISDMNTRATGGTVRATRNREARQTQWETEIALLQRAGRDGARAPELPPGIVLALGSAYFRNGQLADAEREYRAALRSRPMLGEAHNNLAVVLLLTARPQEARDAVEAARRSGFAVAQGLVRDIEAALATASTGR